ncbi:MAG: hypothetical protein KDC87_09310 [Planctomycetes bacterium]|nr:hypothetical protein [Planctomycetota bacterium]
MLVRLHDARTARRHLTQRITALRLAAARASIATAADRVVTRAHRVLADVEQACGALEQRIRAQSPTPPAQQ